MTRLQYMKRDIGSFLRRNALVISMTIIALSILGVFILQSLTIGALQSTVDRQNELISQTTAISHQLLMSGKQRSNQISDVNHHLDCIVQFFSQPDRTSKAIANIETCRIEGTAPKIPPHYPSVSQTAPTTVQTPAKSPTATRPANDNTKLPKTTPTTAHHQNLLQQALGLIGL